MPARLADHDDQFAFIVELLRHFRQVHGVIRSVGRGDLLVEPFLHLGLRGVDEADALGRMGCIVDADAEDFPRAGDRRQKAH